MRPLIVLRPEPGASATVHAAERMGLVALAIPLFEVRPIDWEAPDAAAFDGLLLTSANAVRHAGPAIARLLALPAYCVGEATAAEARDAGFAVVAVGEAGVDTLLGSLAPHLTLLHLCGTDRREPATTTQALTAVPVYESVELPADGRFAAVEGSVAALHSPRAAATFARNVDEAGLSRSGIAVAAISAETAVAAGDGWERVETASEPTNSAILAIASRLCKNGG